MLCLLMCCANESGWMNLSESQRDEIMNEYGNLVQELKAEGKLLSGAKLDSISSAVTVRHIEGKPTVTDGPFAETKEQMGGYHVVDCRDREEAVSIAKRVPTLPYGGVIEARPLIDTE